MRTTEMEAILESAILKALRRERMHGYDIAVLIHQSGNDPLDIADGWLYPALYRMEARGWITSEWGTSGNNRRAKFYKLSRTGRRELIGESTKERFSKKLFSVLEVT